MDKGKLVERILRKEFDDLEIDSITELGGDAKDTFDVDLEDRSLIVHICSESRFEDRFETEDLVLQKVSDESSLPVPKVLAGDISKENFQYMYFISEKLQGYNPQSRFKYLPVEKRKKILFQIGRYIGIQHRDIRFESHGQFRVDQADSSLHVYKKEWTDVLQEIVETFLEDIEWEEYQKLIPIARQTVKENLGKIDGDFKPVLLHNDYSCDNILLEEDRISAILDWEMALSGHKEYDFFKADKRFIDNNFQTPDIRKEMRKSLYDGYGSANSFDRGWEERRKFYRYINIIEGLRVFHLYESELTPGESQQTQKFHKNYIKDGIGSKEDYLYQ